ncbi:MAG TPA: MarR family winged helix-turn-helix transcriptional regulator [Candidatus Paceibacterota bacterium]|nr:MarR family winged helix-turn-helix transcriptional regulator [Candidatus Paceibacterota bacterium]
MRHEHYKRLPMLFFVTRQLMRSKVRSAGKTDPNAWMRLETMRFIASVHGATMRDVAQYLRITAPSATSLTAGLIRRKLLKRERDKKDKRIVRLSLAPEGKKLLAAYERSSHALMHEVFSKLDEHDIRELVRILSTLDGHHRA